MDSPGLLVFPLLVLALLVVVVLVVVAVVAWPVMVAGFMAATGVVVTLVTLGLDRIRRHRIIVPPRPAVCDSDEHARGLNPHVPDQGVPPHRS